MFAQGNVHIRAYQTSLQTEIEKKNKQVTGTFTIALSGQFLPMQLFYQETTDRCLPKSVEFPHDWNVTYTPNHWSNESKAVVIM